MQNLKKEGRLLSIKSAESEEMAIFFGKKNQPNTRVQMGVVTLQPGEGRSLAGYACHKQDEHSYVISGEVHMILEDGQDLIGKAGQTQLIEAGEGYINYNNGLEPAVIVWTLVEKAK